MQRAIIGFHDESVNHGGTTRYLRAILSHLDHSQYEPILFASTSRRWHEDIRALGARVVTLSPAGEASPPTEAPPTETNARSYPLRAMLRAVPAAAWTMGHLRETRRLKALFSRHPVDLLHTNQTGAEVASIAARLCKIPIVVGTWHVDPTYDLAGARSGVRHRALERLSMRSLHQAISVSADTKNQWMRRCGLGTAYANRVAVIHNGIEMERFSRRHSAIEARRKLQIPDEQQVIGSLGRLEPMKGYSYLLEALALVRKELPEFTMLLAGKGPEEESLWRQARCLDLDAQFRPLGFLADVRDLLEPLDIYVQPSLCESLGLGILEAGALGIPAVASRVGGIPETVQDGVTGVLVNQRDPASIANALLTLMRSRETREEMGAKAQDRVQRHFTSVRMARETIALYRKLLGH